MKLTPINNYSQNNNYHNSPLSFNGKLGDSAYGYVKSLKQEIARKSRYPDTNDFKMLDKALESLNSFAKKFHPDTEIQIYRGYESEFHEDFDGPCWRERVKNVYIEAKNSKLNSNKILRRIEIARNGSCDFCEHPSVENFLRVVNEVINSTWYTPEFIDQKLFESSKNSFLEDVKQNKKPSFITKYFARRKAKKLDKMAPEFHSTSDSLEQVNSHIYAWSNFHKEANK